MLNRKMKIKVCGMRDASNIQELCSLPIDYIGFIFFNKSSRYVAELPQVNIPLSIQRVGVFVNATLPYIKEQAALFELDVIQLHGDESPAFCEEIKSLGFTIFKAFGIDEDFDWTFLAAYEKVVDYFLFDTKSKQYGGTGLTFNWEILKQYPYEKAYLLSGGLSIDNIQEALQFEDERLYGLDLNSKFEIEPGLKNIQTLKTALAY